MSLVKIKATKIKLIKENRTRYVDTNLLKKNAGNAALCNFYWIKVIDERMVLPSRSAYHV